MGREPGTNDARRGGRRSVPTAGFAQASKIVDLNDLAVRIVAARRADPVRTLRITALGTGLLGIVLSLVVRAPLALTLF